MGTSSLMNISSAQQNNNNNQQYTMQVNTTFNSSISPIMQNSFIIDQQKLHPSTFFYQSPNDPCNYHINCKEISIDTVIQLLNEFNVSSLTLNKFIYGIEIDQNFVQNLSFTPNQKENLKYYLTQHLNQYLLN
ncbi:hypothetical protein C1646_767561 [Rhizophagus diaphanus]|nr:hypothetical protein C1646_767561 [Rhizophagus diaphanus] [Rhizophagus sp. MUCL 43196]